MGNISLSDTTLSLAEAMIAEAVEAAKAISDDPPGQMHRRAAAGKRIVSHLHGWDRWGNNGDGEIALSLRLEGQSIDIAKRRFESRAEAIRVQSAVDAALENAPAPIAGSRC